MASRRLDFLVFYRGNLATGFDYVYLSPRKACTRLIGTPAVQHLGISLIL